MASAKSSTPLDAQPRSTSTTGSASTVAPPNSLLSLKRAVGSVDNSGVTSLGKASSPKALSGKALSGKLSLRKTARDRSVAIGETTVDGLPVSYSIGGEGPTVLLLHGWGLGHHAYRPALLQLVAAGYHVVAPALPGFGGTSDLGEDRSFAGYSAWVQRFALTLGLTDAIVVGHSFGGGVAIRLGVDDPKLAARLVLCNSVGGAWRRASRALEADIAQVDAMSKRPIWSWTINIPSDVIALLSHAKSAMPSILEDLVPNVMGHPLTITRVGQLARNADLRAELTQLRLAGFPMTVVHSERDGVIPRTSFRRNWSSSSRQPFMAPHRPRGARSHDQRRP
jgi:pimeloyl-ACP methyl ester carboxylesterase